MQSQFELVTKAGRVIEYLSRFKITIMGKTIITEKEVAHVAGLAQLTLKAGEFAKFKNQLSNIFGYIDQISKMKTNGVGETSQTTGIKNRFREDKINRRSMLSLGQALSGSKKTYKGYFVVKSIFAK